MNITDPDLLACMELNHGQQQHCLPPALYASIFHPAGSLKDLQVKDLAQMVPYNKTCDDDTGICTDNTCGVASSLLPVSDMMQLYDAHNLDATLGNPANISVGLLELMDFAHQLFPWPLNESTPGAVVDWWVNATTQDTANVTRLLERVSRECWFDYCKSREISVGNPDIVGYGMFVSIIMLMALSIIFSTLCFEPISGRIRRMRSEADNQQNSRNRRGTFRLSLARTLPDLLTAILTFSASVMISTYVYRWTTHSRFDALMADSLSLLSGTAVTMICASSWATHVHARGYATVSVALVLLLNIVLFSTHFSIFYKPGKTVERLCAQKIASMTPDQRFHQSTDFYCLSAGFVCWFLATVGMALHHPRLNKFRAEDGFLHACWVVGEAMPCLAGTVALAVDGYYYWAMREIMREVHGTAFDTAIRTWGFGQYLAVATWFPPVLQFGYLYCRTFAKTANGRDEAKLDEEPEGTNLKHMPPNTRRWI